MQLVQNTWCRVVCRLPWRSHVSRRMRSLPWLPVKSRINFKLGVIFVNTKLYGIPMYLHEYLVPYTCAVNTRRSNPDKMILKLLTINDRRLHTSFQQLQYSFAFSAPGFWNDLPVELRHSDFLAKFRNGLKTYLFALAYPP